MCLCRTSELKPTPGNASNSLHLQETAVSMFLDLHFLNCFELTPTTCNEQCDLKPAVVNWRSEGQKQRGVREQNVSCWEVLNLLLSSFLTVLCVAISQSHSCPKPLQNKPHGQSIAALVTIGCMLPFTMNCGIL